MIDNFLNDFYEFLLQSIYKIVVDIRRDIGISNFDILWQLDYGEKQIIKENIKRVKGIFGNKVKFEFVKTSEGVKLLTIRINQKYINEIYYLCKMLDIQYPDRY